MVNYCCVYGCGRNNKIHKHLTYYSVPKAKDRQEKWLRAAGREDLLGKSSYSSVRLCSRHFAPSQMKKRHLAPGAIPSISLPGSLIYETQDSEPVKHNGLVCNSCSDPIVGFRYKCIMCHDYDLCQKCEMLEVHPNHLMLRINRPMKFTNTDNLIKKWHNLIRSEQITYGDNSNSGEDNDYQSSDDEPITKYAKGNDSGVDLPEDVKIRIRTEIATVLKSRNEPAVPEKTIKEINKKRSAESKKPSKRLRIEKLSNKEKEADDSDDSNGSQELAFAYVDEFNLDKIIKCETNTTSSMELDDDFSVVIINEEN